MRGVITLPARYSRIHEPISVLSYLKGKVTLFTTMSITSRVRSQMETIFNSSLRRGLILLPIAAGAWVLSMYISSRRAFARVRRLSIDSEARPSDHVGVWVYEDWVSSWSRLIFLSRKHLLQALARGQVLQ